ncbi:hypothetical protein OSB04_006965 [Centaurea solstitialis]|uniref:Uncharacterized protein n=1 Tax=Centaurea solstitialis TaxID=347529 RepID=A0AA38TVN7_9ASTR|nr:hypothetical protein OSB04_006965 [Centaurea solstitialis]
MKFRDQIREEEHLNREEEELRRSSSSSSADYDQLMAGGEDVDVSSLNSQSSQTQSISEHEMEHNNNSPLDIFQGHLGEVTSCTCESSRGDDKKELEVLWRRVKASASVLTYLKSKARIMTVPHLALTSCGITYTDGTGFVDRNGTPMSDWSTNLDFSNSDDRPDVETWIGIDNQHDEQDGVYISEVLNSVQMITDVMEALLKRVLMAETETANEKEKVKLSQEEIIRKEIQIESMSEKLAEMDRFAVDTSSILNEMRQWVDDLIEETSLQRQRATENEEELIRVKREFETLKDFVSGLTSVRETLVPSEIHFQNIEKLFEQGRLPNAYTAQCNSRHGSTIGSDAVLSLWHFPGSCEKHINLRDREEQSQPLIFGYGGRDHGGLTQFMGGLVMKKAQLETEKKQKESEIQKLMDENLRLSALVDRKEAQLVAMSEQCKVFALSASKI